jgi:predicted metal-dependent phosphoesterase TrpH
LHIVGLNINPFDDVLSNLIRHLQTIRQQRAEKIAEKLAKKGIDGAYEAVQRAAGDGMITRTHFADFLVSRFHVNTHQDAFDRYLGEGKVAYVSTIWTPLDVCVKSIKAAGGFAVIAHPLRYKLTATRMKKLLTAFKQLGGDGIEIVTGRYNSDEIRVLATYAKQFELAGSVGSDFHDPSNQWLELGRLAPLPTTVQPIWELWN